MKGKCGLTCLLPRITSLSSKHLFSSNNGGDSEDDDGDDDNVVVVVMA